MADPLERWVEETPPETLLEKKVVLKLDSPIPFAIFDDEGKLIGSAHAEGSISFTILIDKHHPSALDLETENGLAKLKVSASIDGHTLQGDIGIGS